MYYIVIFTLVFIGRRKRQSERLEVLERSLALRPQLYLFQHRDVTCTKEAHQTETSGH